MGEVIDIQTRMAQPLESPELTLPNCMTQVDDILRDSTKLSLEDRISLAAYMKSIAGFIAIKEEVKE